MVKFCNMVYSHVFSFRLAPVAYVNAATDTVNLMIIAYFAAYFGSEPFGPPFFLKQSFFDFIVYSIVNTIDNR